MCLYSFLIFFACTSLVTGMANSQDYTQYYQSINKAEETVFVKEKFNEGLAIYLKTFDKYDFVFLHDCMTALQIALHADNEKALLVIVAKASKNGLLPRHLMSISYIKKHPLYIKDSNTIAAICKENRPYYLRRIDTLALKRMYDLYAYDQMEKNQMKGEDRMRYERRYRPQIKETMDKLKVLIMERGWPSDKTIGIAQYDIMRELQIAYPDILDYYRKNKSDYNISESQFEIKEYSFSSVFFYPIIHHYGSMPFDNGFYVKQIKLGNLHPKDYATLNDMPFVTFKADTLRKPDLSKGEMFFGVGNYTVGQSLPVSDDHINKFRAQYFIAPIQADRAKKQFMKAKGMYIGWGWNGSRS